MLRAALVLLLCVRADGLMDLSIESQLERFQHMCMCVCVCYACTCAREARGKLYYYYILTCGYHNILQIKTMSAETLNCHLLYFYHVLDLAYFLGYIFRRRSTANTFC